MKEYFRAFEEKAGAMGIGNWILDPGFGFAKTVEQNYELLDHLEELMHLLPPHLRAKSAMVSGKMTSKKARGDREQIMQRMRSGDLRFLFATYALAKEGLDIPRLDRLYLTTPQKDYAVITQSIGRIARTCEGKGEPVCFDYVDNIKSLVKAYKRRCTSYRKAGCRFIEEVPE